MGDQVIYLEKYIDSTTSLPAELNRILNSVKDLDERSDDLAAQIQENVEAVLRMAPLSGGVAGTRAKAGGADSREVQELRTQIDKDQQLLIQFAEEKVQLAVQGYDLLEQHLGQADLDIVHLEAELHAMGVGDTIGVSVGGPDYSGGTFDEPPPKRGGSRLRDVPSFDSIDQAAPASDPKQGAAPGTGTRKTTITLNLSRQISGFEPAAAAGEAQTPGVDSLGVAVAPQKRPAAAAPRKAATPAPAQVVVPAEGYQRNRRAAAAGVHAVAAEVAAMEEDDMSPEEQHARLAAQQAQQAAAAAAAQRAAAVAQPMAGVQAVPAPGVPPPVVVSTQLLPGLQQASDRPQAPGRLITYADINPGLKGRHAELYWPANNLWYPIVVTDFDPVTRSAAIVYTGTGEAETLALDEIVKEGHMSLINMPGLR